MPQFFIKSSAISKDQCIIDGDNFKHIVKVRKHGIDDVIDLRLEDGSALRARIKKIRKNLLIAEIIEKSRQREISINITLCAALLKKKNFDDVVQRAVEIGVSRIIPVETERTVPELRDKEEARIARWRSIALEASKQSMRSGVPEISGIMHFSRVLEISDGGVKILAHPGNDSIDIKAYLKSIDRKPDVYLLTGPEGGFSEREAAMAGERGWAVVNFGFATMKSETAALILPSILIYEWS